MRIGLIIIGSLIVSASASAQTIIQTHYGLTPSQHLGTSVCAAGDINGDQAPDYLATDPKPPGGTVPIVYAYSGATGAPLYTLSFPTATVGFGSEVDAGKDIDGNGTLDIMLAGRNTASPAPGLPSTPNSGIYFFSGPTGAYIRARLPPAGYSSFGNPKLLGDLTQDGRTEYGVTGLGPGGIVRFLVFNGLTDALLYVVSGNQAGDGFGQVIAAVDDFDGDAVPDLVIGAPATAANGFSANGAIHAFSGATGQPIKSLYGTQNIALLGIGFAPLGDLDQNGTPDLAIRDWLHNSVRVIDFVTESEIAPLSISTSTNQAYALQIAAVADLDGDGWNDYVTTDWVGSQPAPNQIRWISSRTANVLFRLDDPHSVEIAPLSYDEYLARLANLGDVDADGRDEVLFGHDWLKQPVSKNQGAVEVVSVGSLVADATVLGPATQTKIGFSINGGLEFAGAQHFVLASYTGAAGMPLWGVQVPLSFDPLTELSIYFANTPWFGNTFGTLSSTGRAPCAFDGGALPASADGLQFHFAALLLTPAGKASATRAVTVDIDLF